MFSLSWKSKNQIPCGHPALVFPPTTFLMPGSCTVNISPRLILGSCQAPPPILHSNCRVILFAGVARQPVHYNCVTDYIGLWRHQAKSEYKQDKNHTALYSKWSLPTVEIVTRQPKALVSYCWSSPGIDHNWIHRGHWVHLHFHDMFANFDFDCHESKWSIIF